MTRTLVIAGTASGVGKTSLTLGIARALRHRGVRVLAAKVGPDYLDPKQLTLATGRPCLNLDAFMMGKPYIHALLARASRNVDLVLVEGVMGLFDGVEPHDNHGSTAEMAEWLSANVLLVADARAQARSFAATIQGFVNFPMGGRIAGVIANRVGSDPHAALLSASLVSVGLPPLLGHVTEGRLPNLPSRHLGLLEPRDDAAIDALGAAVERCLPLERLMALGTALPDARALPDAGEPPDAREPPDVGGPPDARALPDISTSTASTAPRKCRLAVAEDAAFSFVYADMRPSLEALGVEWLPCSPLGDSQLPEAADALYLPGGYPEEYAAELAQNTAFLAALRQFARHRPIYAECGGLMLLSRELIDRDGRAHSLAGILPGTSRMGHRLARLGYAQVTLLEDSLWGSTGEQCRGHEFHHSTFELDASAATQWQRAYEVEYRGGLRAHEGYQQGRILASYVHLHFASRPAALTRFLAALSRR